MSHTVIYFITTGEDYNDAESSVESFLEKENFFDYSNVVKEMSGPLSEKRNELANFLDGWEHEKAAEDFLKRAQEYKDKGDMGMYGYKLKCAGELIAQNLTIDTYVYNVDSGDYTIPEDDDSWWLIAVDFRY